MITDRDLIPSQKSLRVVTQPVPDPTHEDIKLWSIVLSSMILDIVLTLYGLNRGLIELNPIVLFGIEAVGYSVLAFLKVPALVIGFLGWIWLPETYRQLNLVGLSMPWIGATFANSWLILMHT